MLVNDLVDSLTMTSYTRRMAPKKAEGKPISEQLADARRKYGMSQEELGDSVGAAGRTVSTWETGIHQPTKRVQATLEALYGWPAGTISYSVRTGQPLPPVMRSFTPADLSAREEDDPTRARGVQGVADALELLYGRVTALEDQVQRLETQNAQRGRRAPHAR